MKSTPFAIAIITSFILTLCLIYTTPGASKSETRGTTQSQSSEPAADVENPVDLDSLIDDTNAVRNQWLRSCDRQDALQMWS